MSALSNTMYIATLFIAVLFSGCVNVNTPPSVYHTTYGLVDTRHPEFKKDAHECEIYAQGGERSAVTIDPANAILDEKLTGALNASYNTYQVHKIFNTARKCISRKGWALTQH